LTIKYYYRLFITEVHYGVAVSIFGAILNEGKHVIDRIALALLKYSESKLLLTKTSEEFLSVLHVETLAIVNLESLIKLAFSFDLPETGKDNSNKMKGSGMHIIYYRPTIEGESNILSSDKFDMVWSFLPNKYKIKDAKLVFSSIKHGRNFTNFFMECEDITPTVLLIKTSTAIFGAFVTASWRRSSKAFYGTRESFVFTLEPKRTAYKWKENDLLMDSKPDYFAIGGPSQAIWVNTDFIIRSYYCQTFDSLPLFGTVQATEQNISVLEVYSFD